MGMTNGQFKAFIRFIIKDLNDLKAETDDTLKTEKIDQLLETLQNALED